MLVVMLSPRNPAWSHASWSELVAQPRVTKGLLTDNSSLKLAHVPHALLAVIPSAHDMLLRSQPARLTAITATTERIAAASCHVMFLSRLARKSEFRSNARGVSRRPV